MKPVHPAVASRTPQHNSPHKPTIWPAILACILALGSAPPAWATPRCEGRLPKVLIRQNQQILQALLHARRYAELQKRLDQLLAAYSVSRLSDEELFYQFAVFKSSKPAMTPLILEWLAKHPHSYAAHQAMASHAAAIAWRTRGNALAADTPDAQMQEFHRQLKVARDWAQRALKLHPLPLLTYEQLVVDAIALNAESSLWDTARRLLLDRSRVSWNREPRPDLRLWMRASRRIQPDNVIVRQAYVKALAPRWGGSLSALKAYARPESHPELSPDRRAAVAYAATMEIAAEHRFDGDLDRAAETYAQAAQYCRLNQPYMDIAEIRLRQHRYPEALQAADQAIALVPDSPAGRRNRALALRGLGRHREAFELLRSLASAGEARVLYLLGDYYASNVEGIPSDPSEARRLLEQAARAGHEAARQRLEALQHDATQTNGSVPRGN